MTKKAVRIIALGKALTDACRTVRVVNRMTKEEGAKAGIDNHRQYFRTINDKANLTPPADKSDWFTLEGVDLGNGPFGAGGDSIGVVTTWQWPDPLAGMTGADFEKAAQAIRAGKWKANAQAADWVGRAIGDALDLDTNNKADKARIVGMLRAWIGAGALFVCDDYDEKRRETKKFVRVSGDS